jgi:hypothetical protein
MSDSPHRIRFFFWLNMEKSDEESVADIIERLKTARRYTAAVRDGLRLVWDLSQGKTDVLLELFPWVATKFATSSGGTDSGGVSKAELEQMLKKMLKEAQNGPLMKEAAPAGLKPLGGLSQIAAKPLAAPSFEDDDDFTLAVNKATGNNSNANDNFIKSMMALQSH